MQALVALLDESSFKKESKKGEKGFIRMKIKCFVVP